MTFHHISNNFLMPNLNVMLAYHLLLKLIQIKTYFQTLLHCTLKQHYSFSNPEKIA